MPMPTSVITLLNEKASSWSQDLKFATTRGIVADMPDDIDILQHTPVYVEDRSGASASEEQPAMIGDMLDAPAYIMPEMDMVPTDAPVIPIPISIPGVQPNAGVQSEPELQFASKPLSDYIDVSDYADVAV